MIAGTQGAMGEVEAQIAAARRRIAALEGQCREIHRGIARCKARLARQRRDAERFRRERNALRVAVREHLRCTAAPCAACGGRGMVLAGREIEEACDECVARDTLAMLAGAGQ